MRRGSLHSVARCQLPVARALSPGRQGPGNWQLGTGNYPSTAALEYAARNQLDTAAENAELQRVAMRRIGSIISITVDDSLTAPPKAEKNEKPAKKVEPAMATTKTASAIRTSRPKPAFTALQPAARASRVPARRTAQSAIERLTQIVVTIATRKNTSNVRSRPRQPVATAAPGCASCREYMIPKVGRSGTSRTAEPSVQPML